MADPSRPARWSVEPLGRPTLADVAVAAHVGESTASRVLRGSGPVSAKARQRVMEAVRTLGYVPNRIAGALASTDSTIVGIVIPSLTNIVFPDLLRGAEEVLAAAGFQAVIGVTDYDPNRELAVVRSMLSWRPAAVLIAGLEHLDETRSALLGSGARVVEMLDLDGEGVDRVVGFSHREVGRASADFLVSRGYRRIGYIGHDVSLDTRAAKRLAGFELALDAAGAAIMDREFTDGPSSVNAGRECLARLLQRSGDLDAVYFSNDDMAVGGYFHCLANGIEIPKSLALFGFNGLDIGQATPLALSTIQTPRVDIGRAAARLAIQDPSHSRLDLGFQLVEGQTA